MQDLGADAITLNARSGGRLRTSDASAVTSGAVFDHIAANMSLRSMTTPAESAWPRSRTVTGQNLGVDGGLVRH